MSFQIFYAILDQALHRLPGMLQCSRRKQPSGCVVSREDFLKFYAKPTSHSAVARTGSKPKGIDVAEASTTDFSDGDHGAGSSDGSDTEAARIKTMLVSTLSAGARRTLPVRRPVAKSVVSTAELSSAPPPLEESDAAKNKVCLDLDDTLAPHTKAKTSRLNSQAALFVPLFATPAAPPAAPESVGQGDPQQLRRSIRLLKDALAEWEESNLADEHQADNPMASVEDQTMMALQASLNKLTPQDAATVKAFLDTKDVPHATAYSSSPMMHEGFPGHHDLVPHAEVFGQTRISAPWPCTPAVGGAPVGMQQAFAYSQPVSRFPQQPKKPKPEGAQSNPADEKESLSSHLRDLAKLDCARVLMVRKINHLEAKGVDAAAAVKTHFSKFGIVERVMVSSTRSSTKPGRLRPATLGFVVMDSAQSVEGALSHGEHHHVEGVDIRVAIFQSHTV